jgi:hypothetical protein
MVRTVVRFAGPALGAAILATLMGGGVAIAAALGQSFGPCIPL